MPMIACFAAQLATDGGYHGCTDAAERTTDGSRHGHVGTALSFNRGRRGTACRMGGDLQELKVATQSCRPETAPDCSSALLRSSPRTLATIASRNATPEGAVIVPAVHRRRND